MTRTLALLLILTFEVPPARAQSPLGVTDDLWAAALRSVLLDRTDLGFRNDYTRPDDARLPVVDAAMRHPARLPGWLARLAREVRSDRFEYPAGAPAPLEMQPPWRWGVDSLSARRAGVAAAHDLPELGLPRALQPLLACVRLLNEPASAPEWDLQDLRHHLDDSTLAFLTHQVPELFWEVAGEEFESAQWQDSVQQAEREIMRRLVPLVRDIPRDQIWAQALLLMHHYAAWSEALAAVGPEAFCELCAQRTAPVVEETDFGRVAYGSAGPDHYAGKFAFIFDPGGDDLYDLEYDAEHPNRVLIDLDGDDVYRAHTDAALAGGFWGTQILHDVCGDDSYRARRLDLGAGMYGWGILIDGAGNDLYEGDTFVQGAGAFGFGLLADSAGNDTYESALFAQGFGSLGGVGVVYDHSGNDHYNAGGTYNATLHYTDRYLSESQGCSYSFRPFLSGGVGLLLDRSGNDDYNCDIGGQGSGYWWGIGALWDGAGNDRYLAYQYAQGSSAHMAVGLLVDEAGDDIYFSKGVSQGCGHDLGPGLLWDLGGNDTYTAWDLSQGAGSANGLGVLFDAQGDDRYYVKSTRNTQGYGNPRRDYGSVGLFLDGGGHDRYDGGPGADSTWWRIESQWGIGLDADDRSGRR
jgi:hypothetical protein